MRHGRDAVVAAVFFALLIVTLPTLPAISGISPGVASAASVSGYSTNAAYALVFLVVVLCLLAYAVSGRQARSAIVANSQQPPGQNTSTDTNTWNGTELIIVGAVAMALYFPPFLARYGPYLEDSYFLTVLHRMQFGQLPYSDFEFQYGPLMIMPAHWWSALFGYSMKSYYWYLAVLESVQYVVLAAVLQRFVARRWVRLGILLLLTAMLFNDNLGLSWNGLRRVGPVLTLLLFACHPKSLRTIGVVALLLGLQIAYSPEYGAAGLLAVLAGFALLMTQADRASTFKRATMLATLTVIAWLLTTTLLLGRGFGDYVAATVHVVTQRSGGEAAFPFAWNLNALAIFALLIVSCGVIGRNFLRLRQSGDAETGDIMMVGGLTYALVVLKSGLARADMYHLVPPMLALIFVFLLPLPRRIFVYSDRVGRAAFVLILVIASTYGIGLSGIGLAYAKGWVQGARDVITGVPTQTPHRTASRGGMIEFERTHPNADFVALAEYLADPVRSERPVLFYGGVWGLDKHIGVAKQVFATDDYLMTDDEGKDIQRFLQQRNDAIVLMEIGEYGHVFESAEVPGYGGHFLFSGTPIAPVLELLSSTHYGQAVANEKTQKVLRWERTVGIYVRTTFHRTNQFGNVIVLERSQD